MKTFKEFAPYNEHFGLPKPLDNDIDFGYYDAPNILLKTDTIMVDFYRISIKINLKRKASPDAAPINAVFFNSPDLKLTSDWDVEPTYTGMYLQLSKKIIEKNRFLFKTYLDYGLHEALYLTDKEVSEITTVFELMMKYYENVSRNMSVLLSYVNVLISLVEAFYKRQFSTNPKQYNPIVSEFQRLLYSYYDAPTNQTPTVQYFADKLGLSSNYLGDIIKHFTQKSAIENIHDFVISKAKDMLENRSDLNNTQIAYELGFEYANYFSKFFKKITNQSPTEYRQQFLSKK